MIHTAINITEEQEVIGEKCAIYSTFPSGALKVIARAGTGNTYTTTQWIIIFLGI